MITVEHLDARLPHLQEEAGILGRGHRALPAGIRGDARGRRHQLHDPGGGIRSAFLGPNGAGKTTTLKRLLAGLIRSHERHRPRHRRNFDPSKRENAYRRIFALVLGQKNQLWWDLPASESFTLLRADLRPDRPGLSGNPGRTGSTSWTSARSWNVMVRELSLGERMKMELIAALLHRPLVLFLDEPTIGLDVVSQKAVRQFLRDYNRRERVTILLTSHYMSDIKELCERVIVIHKGLKIYDGRPRPPRCERRQPAEDRHLRPFRPQLLRRPVGRLPRHPVARATARPRAAKTASSGSGSPQPRSAPSPRKSSAPLRGRHHDRGRPARGHHHGTLRRAVRPGDPMSDPSARGRPGSCAASLPS